MAFHRIVVRVPLDQLEFVYMLAADRMTQGAIYRALRKEFPGCRLTRPQIDGLLRGIRRCHRWQREGERIARAQRLAFLPEHRLPNGRIDWPSVKGWSDWRAIAREAAREELAAA